MSEEKHDAVLAGYENWLNEILFTNLEEGEHLHWLGNARWMITSAEGPEIFEIRLRPARVVSP